MNKQNTQRITVKMKCPNPLFELWLTEWRDQAVAKESKMQYSFNNALKSLKKYPLPLQSGQECKVLKGFGNKLCEMLDNKLADFRKDNVDQGILSNFNSVIGNPITETKTSVKTKSKKPVEEKSTTKDYVPQYGSGGYAILIALYRQSLLPSYPGYLKKVDIIKHGKDFVNSSFTKPDPNSRYTAWSSMRTLLSKNLVSKESHPPKFSLTEKGTILAKKLDSHSQNITSLDDAIITIEDDDTCFKSNRLSPEVNAIDLSGTTANAILTDSWSVEGDTLSFSPDKQLNFKKVDRKLGENLKSSVENFPTESQTFNSNFSVHLKKPETASNLQKGKTIRKFVSADALMSPKNSRNVLKRHASVMSLKGNVFENFVMAPNSFDIILYVDTNETSGSSTSENDEILVELRKHNIKHEVKNLKVGDFIWICRDKITNRELLLPYIIERKRMDDFAHSIKDKRYYEQKFRLKKSGVENLIYLVESYGRNQHLGLPLQNLLQAATNTALQDNFFVKFTTNIRSTAEYLAHFSEFLVSLYKSKTLESCSKDEIKPVDINKDIIQLITFKEYHESSIKNKRMMVTDLFIKMLIQIKGMSVERALAITRKYPTPYLLRKAYEAVSVNDGEKLLSNVKYGDAQKNLGATLSRIVHQVFSKTSY